MFSQCWVQLCVVHECDNNVACNFASTLVPLECSGRSGRHQRRCIGAPKPSSRTRGMGPMVRNPGKFRDGPPRAILPPHQPHVHPASRLTSTNCPTLTTPNLSTTPTISSTTSCQRNAFPPSSATSSPTQKQPSPTPNQRTRSSPPGVGSQRGQSHEAHQGGLGMDPFPA